MASRRVRTGCLKCRVRRRKCDEGKPRCQRCITGGFECQYGTRLSFLSKNSLTIDTSSPAKPQPSSYQKVQFVDAGSASKDESRTEREPEAPSSPVSARQPLGTTNTGVASPEGVDRRDFAFAATPHSAPLCPLSPADSFPVTAGRDGDQPLRSAVETPSGRYRDALDALMSLGADEAENADYIAPSPQGGDPAAFLESPARQADTAEENRQLDQLMLCGPPATSESAPGLEAGLPPERRLLLLKHWRYEVAPWLDICDLGQGFGVYLSGFAAHSEAVSQAILSLSAVSHDHKTGFRDQLAAPGEDGRPPWPGPSVSATPAVWSARPQSRMLCMALARTRDFVVGKELLELPAQHTDALSSYVDCPSTSILETLGFHLLLRISLATALVNEKPFPVPLHRLWGLPAPWLKSAFARGVYACANEPLLYCARALDLCYEGATESSKGASSSGGGGSLVSAWISLVDDLDSWRQRRPQEFMPIIEVDEQSGGEGAEDGIPMVLYTNGAAGLANQLYHTAMLLLLQHKPRTAPAPPSAGGAVRGGRGGSPSASFQWHARRICGAALNNTLRECWDPALVASLVVASRRMSHETQRGAILDGFRRVAGLTCWNLDLYAGMLRRKWECEGG